MHLAREVSFVRLTLNRLEEQDDKDRQQPSHSFREISIDQRPVCVSRVHCWREGVSSSD